MGTIESLQDAINYLTYTFFLRRLLQNPAYYGLTDGTDPESVSAYLSNLVGGAVERLVKAQCVELSDTGDVLGGDRGDDGGDDDESARVIRSTFFGRIASTFYLRNETMKVFAVGLTPSMEVIDVIRILCAAKEYEELPVRHNEDVLNAQLIPQLRHPMPIRHADKPSCKAEILIQAHLDRLQLPVSDYVTDTRTVLDNSTRILQAMIEVLTERGWWTSCYAVMRTIQCLMQATWEEKSRGGSRRESGRRLLPDVSFSATFRRSAGKVKVEVDAMMKVNRANNRVPKAYAPCFPKLKEEGWWCAVVDVETDSLLALKRFAVPGSKATARIPLETDRALARILHERRMPAVHVVSDCYVGLDTQLTPVMVDE
jgi:activating signal cointegrator complex subunit 3